MQLEGGELRCEPGGVAPEPSFPEPMYHRVLCYATCLHHNEQKQAWSLRADPGLETDRQGSNPGSATY